MTSTTTKMKVPSHYEVLGVDKYADTDQIRKAYHKLALKYHPDKSGSESTKAKFQAISAAYDCLSDAKLRREYDGRQTSRTRPREDYYDAPDPRQREDYYDAPEPRQRGSQGQRTRFSTEESYSSPRADYRDVPPPVRHYYSTHFPENYTQELPEGIRKPPPGPPGSLRREYQVETHTRFSASVEQRPRNETYRTEMRYPPWERLRNSHADRPQSTSPRSQTIRRSSQTSRRSAGDSGSYTARLQEPYRGVDRPVLSRRSRTSATAEQTSGSYVNNILNPPRNRHSDDFYYSRSGGTSSSPRRPHRSTYDE